MQSERKAEAEELRKQIEYVIDPRKCVHIKIPSELHAEMRVLGSEFCQLMVDGDSYLQKRMDDLAKRKKEKRIKKLTTHDADNIYDYIASGKEP